MTGTVRCAGCGTADPPIIRAAWASGGGVRRGYGFACSACNRAAVIVGMARGQRAAWERVHGPVPGDRDGKALEQHRVNRERNLARWRNVQPTEAGYE